jgi:hypothetical protein
MPRLLRNKKTGTLTAPVAKEIYDRERDLPKLAGLWPSELKDLSIESTERIIMLLRKFLRMERQRGKSGHWTYDLNRHLALKNALGEEMAKLLFLQREEISLRSGVQARGDLKNDLRNFDDHSAVNQNKAVVRNVSLAGVVLRIPNSIELISDADGQCDIVT